MVELVVVGNFLLALALGALIGLEREYARYRKHAHDYAGIRTFPLIALFGALSAFLGEIVNPLILVVGILLMGALIILSYFVLSSGNKKFHGATSEVAGFLTFFIGVLSYFGEIQLAVLLTVIITIILYSRTMLHQFAQHLKKEEMRSTLLFAVIAFVILPFLPNQGYGPHQLFNPYLTWLMVVFISGISFVGYILMKWFGERGIQFAGLLGGLASSTAVTLSFTEKSNQQSALYKTLALGVILANGMMFGRVLLEVFALNRILFIQLLLPMIILMLVTGTFSYLMWKKVKNVTEKIELKSPFTLKPAIKFAAIFAVVLAFLKLAEAYLSSQGVYLVSFLSGLADADAITLSLAQIAGKSISYETARNGIITGVLANIALKGGLTLFLGEKKFAWTVISFFLVLIIIGTGLIFLL
ncbi:MAG TPA: MgtC/SapB family protein [Candidatus Nanoarchaeia archaeon]|nr:MgtC/SapB family protein [Candidatus Nanoarchaeia archaeon]